MTTPYRLYGRSAAGSWVVQVALEEAGAPYERIWVGRDAADIEGYRNINPTGKVPGLVLPDGTSMFESAAMLIYLGAQYPRSGLAPPPGDSSYARFLQWMVFLSANLYESVLRVYYSDRYTAQGEAGAAAIRGQATQDFFGCLKFVSAHLKPYILGAEYSIADAYLYMLTTWWADDKEALFIQLPALKAHAALIAARPAAIKVQADHDSAA